MKIFVSFLAVIAAAGLAYLMASNRAATRHQADLQQKENAWQEAKTRFEEALEKARKKPPVVEKVVEQVAVAVTVESDPQQHIDHIIALAGKSGDRLTLRRRIVHEFEAMVDAGSKSLPVIQTFLDRNEDIALSGQAQVETIPSIEQLSKKKKGKGTSAEFFSWRRSQNLSLPKGSFDVPPTLRLGVMEVAYRIGGEPAEAILVNSLESAVRGIEIAWLTAWLEKLAPGKHRELALAVARNRLANPLESPDGNLADRLTRSYLMSVLVHFGDTSMNGQLQLVNADGRLDHTAAGVLKSTLKQNVMPLVAAAYANPDLEARERRRLVSMSQEFIGSHPQADEIFNSLLHSESKVDGYDRYFAIEGLDGGGMPEYGQQPPPTDPAVIQNRISLIEQFVQSGRQLDPKTTGLMEHTYNSLQRLAQGQPPLDSFRPGGK
ncbi:MAG: hypothetical protein ACPGVU_19485 [Limisphaerales bacterium]